MSHSDAGLGCRLVVRFGFIFAVFFTIQYSSYFIASTDEDEVPVMFYDVSAQYRNFDWFRVGYRCASTMIYFTNLLIRWHLTVRFVTQ